MSTTFELTQDLISRRSVTPADEGCQDVMSRRLEAAGFRIERLRYGIVDNLWARRGTEAPVLCFAGHTDVVPPGDAAGWAAVVWLGVFNSAAAFALMFLLLRWRSTVHVSALLNLVPATTALVAVPVLGEPLTVQAVLGLVVALVGMYVGLGLVRRRPVGTTSA